MSVERVVPDLVSRSLEDAKGFYGRVFGLKPVMDLDWIVTLADPDRSSAQVSLMTRDATAPVVPDSSLQVDDVDAAYAAAVEEGAEIVHPSPTNLGAFAAFSSTTPTVTSSTCSATADPAQQLRAGQARCLGYRTSG